jgi:hypothetical protein
MIYNGFRRIALAHSLLPDAPATQDGLDAPKAAERETASPARIGAAETLSGREGSASARA